MADNFAILDANGNPVTIRSTDNGGVQTRHEIVDATVPVVYAYTDHSGTITAGGTAQTAMSANPNRKGFFVRNPRSATESLWIRFTGDAAINGEVTGSIELGPGDIWSEQGSGTTTQALSVVAATTGHIFTLQEAL